MLTPVKIAVMVSGGGTNLQALIDAEQSGIIKSGKISFGNRAEKVFAVFFKNLEVSFCPAKTLVPGLDE